MSIESHTLAVSPSGTVFHILKERERAFDAKSHPYVGVAAWTQVKPSTLERILRGGEWSSGERIRAATGEQERGRNCRSRSA